MIDIGRLQHNAWQARARAMGADHAAAVQGAMILTDDEARTIVHTAASAHDVVRAPDLSGEFADALTPDSLFREVTGRAPEVELADLVNEMADAYEQGVSDTFTAAVYAMAYRTLGFLNEALSYERAYEATASELDDLAGMWATLVDDVPKFREAVALGASGLDAYAADTGEIPTDWWELVEVDRLEMSDPHACLLGQVWRHVGLSAADEHWHYDYFDGVRALGLVTEGTTGYTYNPEPVRYGFNVAPSESEQLTTERYALLADAWRELIALAD